MKKQLQLLLICFMSISTSSLAQIKINLRNSFIDSIKNAVTISTSYTIMKAHPRPNPPSKDGDMHVAGEATQIDLAVVAEIMNAKFEKNAVDYVHQNEGTGTAVPLKGVWRIWPEHAGQDIQDQSAGHDPIVNTNPPHVFEIHPITKIGGIDCISSLHQIDGFEYKDAATAFNKYASMPCTLSKKGNYTSITTKSVGYNYVDFWIEIIDDNPKIVKDGRFVFCSVLDENGEVLYNKMRMAFPKGSSAEQKVSTLKPGDQMHVLGIPRVDLAVVSYRIKHANTSSDILTWNLPVEMVIVGEL